MTLLKKQAVKFLKSHKSVAGFVVVVLVVITFSVVYMMATETESLRSQKWIRNHPLLSKRLAIEQPNDILVNFVPLRKAVKYYLSKTEVEHSFYLEYLPTGTTVRSNENTQLAGASLLKLPTIISLYRASEERKISLDKVVTVKKEWVDNGFGEFWKKGAGTKISLRQTARLALVDSDNTAIKTIRGSLGEIIPDNETVLSQLDVDFPYTIDGQSQVGARDYASVLKCLYLSCYLDTADSQEILGLMSQAPDYGRLAGGVPDSITVAHKIGVFKNQVQSDCGIVYAPNRPYLLCMILKEPTNQAGVHMRELSKLIYDYITDPSRQ